MNYSNIALDILAAKECGILTTNADFYKKYPTEYDVIKAISSNESFEHIKAQLAEQLNNDESNIDGFICCYDKAFPVINKQVIKNSEKPFLLFYRGDISLLEDLNNNVAVIGCIDPSEEIIQRERTFVEKLIEHNLTIVSGLATGCDSVAHQVCVENNKKTIAILPSTLKNIYPAENRELAEEIVANGGLLITEYYKDPKNKFEAINRFVLRDNLQAMFSKAVILSASYRQGEGDSGSRHAMNAAKNYKIATYAMFNESRDQFDPKFGLNKDLLKEKNAQKLLPSSILEIKNIHNPDLVKEQDLFAL